MLLVYQSPKSFLNNGLFMELFFSVEFQSWLILIVVDKAHMIYAWGLVETGKSKHLNAQGRIQDYAVFCPSYDKIGDRLMATNNVPLLLLSATC
jgi:superfamily II DNA helicase RecQ